MTANRQKLTRFEMIKLVNKIMRMEGSEEEIHADIALFDENCTHPRGNGLIFWPHGVPHDPSKPNPTAEEIVDLALNEQNVIRL